MNKPTFFMFLIIVFSSDLVYSIENFEQNRLYCKETSHPYYQTECYVIDEIILPKFCIELPDESYEGDVHKRCVERRVTLDYSFACELFDDHGIVLGVGNSSQITRKSVFIPNEISLFVEGYGPFLITDTDPELTSIARFSNGCILTIDDVTFDISAHEKSLLNFRLDTLEQLKVILDDLVSAGSKANLIKAIMTSLDPDGLVTMLTSLKSDLELIEIMSFSDYSRVKLENYINSIDSHLIRATPDTGALTELLEEVTGFHDEVYVEFTELTSSYLVYAANVLNLAKESVFDDFKVRYENVCIDITEDVERCSIESTPPTSP